MFMPSLYFPAYALVVLALVGLSLHALLCPERPLSVDLAAVVNLLTFMPAFVLFGVSLLGASLTVQFDLGDPATIDLWSAWARLWGFFVLVLLSCLVVAVVNALVFLASCCWWSAPRGAKLPMVFLGLTVVHCLFATHWVVSNFPNA
jgi:hypothetical protein